ncbi:hypothetical protein EHV15_17185 [Paenibacillus oralis]|uniref:Uncharacterized protein n=1 Tax=Paenibacillus oralis TaxID=2490856 RepID=A0A3P3U299_9BACL|nr:hypothetical protein [Paenibacillus oralis]RRJ64462.1 hypothetical protein EHV15_17185 [Paenibacillus oralis]
METTICPWCQTEIVWDEELGPEDECPHCHNELKGYRTVSITLGSEEEFEGEYEDHPFGDRKHGHHHDHNHDHDHGHEGHDHDHDHAHHHGHDHEDEDDYWDDEHGGHLGAVRRLEAFTASGGDLLAYETGVEKLLDHQDEVPECPHCREYMIYAGQQELAPGNLDAPAPVPSGLNRRPLLQAPVKLNVYVCSACFHVSRFLSEDDRISFIRTVSGEEDASNK